MPTSTLPYINAPGNITKVLGKIKQAETPPKFTQDFLATTLDMGGGSAKPVIPFLKRTGSLASDGAPTELYRRFRNPSQSGAAAYEALRIGYKPLYSINEYIHDAKDAALKGAVVQATGAEDNAKAVTAIVGSFKALKAFADFKGGTADVGETPPIETPEAPALGLGGELPGRLKFGYTINLHLPATSDVTVFNAIFKSLREHLLR